LTKSQATTVKNLKLAHKMLVLSVLLMGSMLAVAYVAVNRLSELNAEIRQLVDRTVVKREVLSDLQAKFLAGVRAQKNASMAPDDERSREFATTARSLMTESPRRAGQAQGPDFERPRRRSSGGRRGARQGARRLPKTE